MSSRTFASVAAAALAGAALIALVPPTPLSAQPQAMDASRHWDEDKLSQPTFKVRMEHNVRVPMRDGVTLSADLYLPDVLGKYPALLWRTPYSNNTQGNVEQSKWFASRGYVVVTQDVRGKYDSDGPFYTYRHEADDGYDTDEWIGKQSWSNGKIGAMGGSYLGYTQISQAMRGSKYLTAMAATVTTSDIYNNWVYVDGALFYGFAFPWGSIAMDGHVQQYTAAYDWPRPFDNLPISTSDAAASHVNQPYRDWLKHPLRSDPYWKNVSFEDEIHKINVPFLVIDGWYDIFMRGALRDDIAIRSKGTDLAKKGKRLMIGPWAHGTGVRILNPAREGQEEKVIDFGEEAEIEMRKISLRWHDHWLKGIDNGVATEPPVKIFVMGENRWRYEQEWPLARTQYTKYYIQSDGRANSLNGNGRLSTTAPTGAETDTFTYDPASPVPTLGGNTCCSAVPSGPWDQRKAEERDDVLVFTTGVLSEAVEVTGPLSMTLYAATSAKDTDWTAKLVDVHPDGYAQNIQDGILRARQRNAIGKAATLLEPGRVYEYTIDMWATSNVFLPGHRIRLEVSSSNFPRFDRNLNTGEDQGAGTRMEKAQQTIHHSAKYPSHVVLPIIPRTARTTAGGGLQVRNEPSAQSMSSAASVSASSAASAASVSASSAASAASVSASSAASAAQEPRLSGGRPILGPPPGVAVFRQHCASCHTAEGVTMGGRAVPSIASLNAAPPERIYAALTSGTMMAQGAKLDDRQKRDVAAYLAKRPFIDVEGTGVAKMANRCEANAPLPDLASTPSWNGWAPGTNNARFQSASSARLTSSDVPKLKLKWAFGLPGGGSTSSQPSVALGRVFVGSDTNTVFAIDAATGCAHWSYHADSPGRFAPVVGPIAGHAGVKYAVYFVTGSATAYALDAQNGTLLWKTKIEGPSRVSNSAALHDGRLYVPLTGTETVSGVNPDYECCRTRGGVAAIDANTGQVAWKVDSIPEPLQKIGVNAKGKTLWGPSGASVWNTPTIDAKRRRVYVGTGNSFGPIAASTSDAILALGMDDGRIAWSHQEFENDAFMLGCDDKSPPGGNCPEKLGPDWDFGGSSVILQTLPNGRDILVAAGKGGIAIALDPDKGTLLWRTKLYDSKPPTADGLVIFGGAADGTRAYFPLQQPGGGLTAVRLESGVVDWKATLDTDARGQIGPASAIPGVVFTGGWDGVLRAVDASGQVIWRFDTRRDFQTINGVAAKGGSLGSPGPTIANGMVYVSSGYVGMQNGSSGNVVLAFSAE